MEHPIDTKAQLRVACGIACKLLSVLLMNQALFPLFDAVFTYARDISITVSSSALIAVAMVAIWRPRLIDARKAGLVLALGAVASAAGIAGGLSTGWPVAACARGVPGHHLPQPADPHRRPGGRRRCLPDAWSSASPGASWPPMWPTWRSPVSTPSCAACCAWRCCRWRPSPSAGPRRHSSSPAQPRRNRRPSSRSPARQRFCPSRAPSTCSSSSCTPPLASPCASAR